MKRLPLILSPDPLLQQVSKPVEKVDEELRSFMKDMLNTMYNEQGVGLAAVQVGRLIRVLVMDVNYEIDESNLDHDCSGCCDVKVKNTKPKFLVNPKIINSSSDTSSFNEGCLSFPGARSEVTRPQEVEVEYLDFDGNKKVEKMDGLLATCVQHEIDHLNGITFVDHISRLKRDMILRKMKKLNK